MKLWWSWALILILWGSSTLPTWASPLQERLANFPHWEAKPQVEVAKGDLIYPAWMAGTWQTTSTLVEMVAPLAPEIQTPGFEANLAYLHKPVQFPVRFQTQTLPATKSFSLPFLYQGPLPIVADRAFNGLKIAEAYLGEEAVIRVQVDPENPNRQISKLRGDRQLVSTVTGRATETPQAEEFITTEVTQQLFRSPTMVYLNEVETTTDYKLVTPNLIEADQVTAIYLSPQDPDYFRAAASPVALYRYNLTLERKL